MLLKIKDEKPQLVTLCGLTHQETELDLSRKGLGPADAMLLAPEIAVSHSLTQVLARFIQPCSVCLSVLISGGLMHRSTSLTMHSAASRLGGAPTLQRGSTQSLMPCASAGP